jgi:hypothetical protein
MMRLAETSLSDGFAVVIVATVLFLLLLCAVVFVRWVFRLICGRSNPEAVILVFPNGCQESENENEGREILENFAWFLHTKLRENQLGYFAEFSHEGEGILVFFKGADANQIWKTIQSEAIDKTPERPLRVILERSKKNGGQRTIEAVAWQPASISLPRPELPTIPERWIRLVFYSKILTNLGIGGLFSWGILRQFLKLSENEFRVNSFGNYSAWIIGTLLIAGLSLKWFSHVKIRSFVKQAGFPADESSTSTILKYVLLLVIIIFGLVFVLVV